MAEYILQTMAICVADYAGDEHPYEEDPERPETCSEYSRGWSDACYYIRFKLEGIPPDDAEPVRHGTWRKTSVSYWRRKQGGESSAWHFVRCSRCGSGSSAMTNYCPNCGAKMDGDAE